MNALSHSSRIRKRIVQLASRRRAVERLLLSHKEMYKGTVVKVLRTCGNPGCKCARGHKHQCWQISASIEGKTRTRHVPRKYIAEIGSLTNNYRRFRSARATWVRINFEIRELINQLEAAKTTEDFSDGDRR